MSTLKLPKKSNRFYVLTLNSREFDTGEKKNHTHTLLFSELQCSRRRAKINNVNIISVLSGDVEVDAQYVF